MADKNAFMPERKARLITPTKGEWRMEFIDLTANTSDVVFYTGSKIVSAIRTSRRTAAYLNALQQRLQEAERKWDEALRLYGEAGRDRDSLREDFVHLSGLYDTKTDQLTAAEAELERLRPLAALADEAIGEWGSLFIDGNRDYCMVCGRQIRRVVKASDGRHPAKMETLSHKDDCLFTRYDALHPSDAGEGT